jgi:predicted nucleotidyltransferase
VNSPAPSPLALAVSRLAETYHPEDIWLFGSQARNQADADSDFDLLMVVPDDADRQHRQSALAYRALRSIGRAFDISIWRRSAFDEQTRSTTSLPSTVLREGRLLYAA